MTSIFCLHAVPLKYLSKRKGRFYCLFINFAKAFDSVEHDKLWDALIRKGVGGKYLNAIKSLYANLKSCVKTTKGLTDYFHCSIGTRQGCKCSPIIFSLFINDVVSYLRQECNYGVFVSEDTDEHIALMYADDIANFADTVARLQKQIDMLSLC